MIKNRMAALLLAGALSFPLVSFAAQVPLGEATAAQVEAVSRININQADAPQLQAGLNGVGEVKAKAIVNYRETHGAFASVDEILEVNGIGPAILESNRDRLSVE